MGAYEKLHPRARTIGQAYGEENEAAVNAAGEYTAGGSRVISMASGAGGVVPAATIFGLTPMQAVLAGVVVWLLFFRK